MNKNQLTIITGAAGTLGGSIMRCLDDVQHYKFVIVKKESEELTISADKIFINDLERIDIGLLTKEVEVLFENFSFTKINVIHSAGFYQKFNWNNSVKDMQIWSRMFQVHVTSLAIICQILYPYFKHVGGGSIVAISSNLTERCNLGSAPYIATKQALQSLIRTMAYEFGIYNIRCNVVSPGYFRSKMSQLPVEKEEKIRNKIPLKRISDADEIATLVVSLLNDEYRYITGNTIILDGGNTIGY